MCRTMKGNKTGYKLMGCHSEHTVVLHKHLKGAKQVSVVPIFQCSSLHPVCCHRLGRSAGELLQCSAVIFQWSVSLKGQNKHSNVFYTKVPSRCLLASHLLCSSCLSAAADLGAVLFVQIVYLSTHLVFFYWHQSCEVKTFNLKNIHFSWMKITPCINSMMMHFCNFPEKGFWNSIHWQYSSLIGLA